MSKVYDMLVAIVDRQHELKSTGLNQLRFALKSAGYKAVGSKCDLIKKLLIEEFSVEARMLDNELAILDDYRKCLGCNKNKQ